MFQIRFVWPLQGLARASYARSACHVLRSVCILLDVLGSKQKKEQQKSKKNEEKKMITDKQGKVVSLEDILNNLTGTDDADDAKSVMDFALYPIDEKQELGDPQYYLIASEAIVTQISFVGPFAMVEVDFRNIGIQILNQVMQVINQFHSEVNMDNVLMLSTITPLDEHATHIISLANPLICVRGYSEEGNGSTILQLVYSVDNIGFMDNMVDYARVNAEIEKELHEVESYHVTDQNMEAAEEETNPEDAEMQQMFQPDFGLRDTNERYKQGSSIRVAGEKAEKIKGKETERIGLEESDTMHKKEERI